MVAPDSSEKPGNVDNGILTSPGSLPGLMEEPNMNLSPLKSEEPQDHELDKDQIPGKNLPPETPEEAKKPKSVGFCEVDLDFSATPLEYNGRTTEGGSEGSVDMDDLELLKKTQTQGTAEKPLEDAKNPLEDAKNPLEDAKNPLEDAEEDSCCTADELGHNDETSTFIERRKHSIPTCLCKECVENLLNAQEKQKEEPGKNNGHYLSPDSTSLNSNLDRSRSGSERSKRSLSNGDDTVCRYEDTQVTLPYPDYGKPPDHITRLSNAGLFEPCEDQIKKTEAKDQEAIEFQMVNTAFFIQHESPGRHLENSRKLLLETRENMDIEKGEVDVEPLLRGHRYREPDDEPRCCKCSTGHAKIVGSFITSLLVFPIFLYLTYTFLPFDAPLMPDITNRLVYTIRCGAFALVPIVLGVIIHGVSRLCASSFDPFKPKVREVIIHRRFVKQSTFLFVLYFFNLAVLATYLPQDYLKIIPLLTCLFALSQLIYWLSFAVGRSFRGFGYGLAFLPLVSMLGCNLCFMFLLEPEKMVYLGSPDTSKADPKVRTWG
ncbi:hypothetical protein GDO86_019525 [Hymenochirus boettgeri]|uniref:Transmembrane protein 79 n=1 Tax=Hymenochirus boettgeri TaxID=247094 RepID=A0A8T2INF4_9PIPI|nr:hypothetical protein GDO86_019525 [Hymenochirus boettgeri]